MSNRRAMVWGVFFLLGYPFVYATAKVMGFLRRGVIVKNAIRVTSQGAQTATATYRRASDGKQVQLVGMVHVGEPQYFTSTVQQIAAEERAGACILYEMVKSEYAEGEPKPDLPVREQKVAEAFNNLRKYMRDLPEIMQIEHQFDQMSPRESWVHTDVSAERMNQMIVEKDLDDYVVEQFGTKVDGGGLPRTAVVWWYLTDRIIELAPAKFLFRIGSWFNSDARAFNGILLGRRNDVAVNGIMKALESHDRIVSIWGAAHLPGIAKVLKRQGFKLADVSWRTAYHYRRVSFKQFADALEAFAEETEKTGEQQEKS